MEDKEPQADISRPELIAKLQGLISHAQSLPLEELCKAGDYTNNPGAKYPQSEGEHIVVEALDLLLSQDWVDYDPLLDEITSVFGSLDTGVDRPETWHTLFDLAQEL